MAILAIRERYVFWACLHVVPDQKENVNGINDAAVKRAAMKIMIRWALFCFKIKWSFREIKNT